MFSEFFKVVSLDKKKTNGNLIETHREHLQKMPKNKTDDIVIDQQNKSVKMHKYNKGATIFPNTTSNVINNIRPKGFNASNRILTEKDCVMTDTQKKKLSCLLGKKVRVKVKRLRSHQIKMMCLQKMPEKKIEKSTENKAISQQNRNELMQSKNITTNKIRKFKELQKDDEPVVVKNHIHNKEATILQKKIDATSNVINEIRPNGCESSNTLNRNLTEKDCEVEISDKQKQKLNCLLGKKVRVKVKRLRSHEIKIMQEMSKRKIEKSIENKVISQHNRNELMHSKNITMNNKIRKVKELQNADESQAVKKDIYSKEAAVLPKKIDATSNVINETRPKGFNSPNTLNRHLTKKDCEVVTIDEQRKKKLECLLGKKVKAKVMRLKSHQIKMMCSNNSLAENSEDIPNISSPISILKHIDKTTTSSSVNKRKQSDDFSKKNIANLFGKEFLNCNVRIAKVPSFEGKLAVADWETYEEIKIKRRKQKRTHLKNVSFCENVEVRFETESDSSDVEGNEELRQPRHDRISPLNLRNFISYNGVDHNENYGIAHRKIRRLSFDSDFPKVSVAHSV